MRWLLPFLLLAGPCLAEPPPGTDMNSPEHQWWEGAKNPECRGCCSIADGRVVRAQPDSESPEGYDVLMGDKWVPVPANVRAKRCDDYNGTPFENYPPHPSGSAVIWEYPKGTIRCWIPPQAGG